MDPKPGQSWSDEDGEEISEEDVAVSEGSKNDEEEEEDTREYESCPVRKTSRKSVSRSSSIKGKLGSSAWRDNSTSNSLFVPKSAERSEVVSSIPFYGSSLPNSVGSSHVGVNLDCVHFLPSVNHLSCDGVPNFDVEEMLSPPTLPPPFDVFAEGMGVSLPVMSEGMNAVGEAGCPNNVPAIPLANNPGPLIVNGLWSNPQLPMRGPGSTPESRGASDNPRGPMYPLDIWVANRLDEEDRRVRSILPHVVLTRRVGRYYCPYDIQQVGPTFVDPIHPRSVVFRELLFAGIVGTIASDYSHVVTHPGNACLYHKQTGHNTDECHAWRLVYQQMMDNGVILNPDYV